MPAAVSVGGVSRRPYFCTCCREEALAAGTRDQADVQIRDRSSRIESNVHKLRECLNEMASVREELRAA